MHIFNKFSLKICDLLLSSSNTSRAGHYITIHAIYIFISKHWTIDTDNCRQLTFCSFCILFSYSEPPICFLSCTCMHNIDQSKNIVVFSVSLEQMLPHPETRDLGDVLTHGGCQQSPRAHTKPRALYGWAINLFVPSVPYCNWWGSEVMVLEDAWTQLYSTP